MVLTGSACQWTNSLKKAQIISRYVRDSAIARQNNHPSMIYLHSYKLYLSRRAATNSHRLFLSTTSTPTNSRLLPAGGSGLPSNFTATPTLPSTRHAAVAAGALSTPRILEEPFVERSRAGAAAAFAILLAGAVAALYTAARSHTPSSDLARMTEAAAVLRNARANARVALLGAATASGAVKVGGVGEQAVRWWASGPLDAPIFIALAADDGENAVQWGKVHARLAAARPDVCVITYDRAGVPARVAGVAGPLSLRIRDATAAVTAARASSSSSSTKSGNGGSRDSVRNDFFRHFLYFFTPRQEPPRVLYVGAGQGAWGALGAAGVGANDAAVPLGAVLVMPTLFHRGRLMAWVDAVTAASRVPHDAANLRSLLEAPTVVLTPALRNALDDSSPRRRSIVGFFENFGTTGATEAMRARFSEDFRRARAVAPVLNDAELSLLGALARMAPHVRAITLGPQCAPSWTSEATHAGIAAVWIVAATAAGALMLEPGTAAHATASNARLAARARLESELSGGLVGAPPVASDAGSAEAAHTSALFARIPAALGLTPPLPPQDSFAVKSLLSELALLPHNFSLALLTRSSPEGVDEDDVVSLPLQRPDFVVNEILAVLGEGERVMTV